MLTGPPPKFHGTRDILPTIFPTTLCPRSTRRHRLWSHYGASPAPRLTSSGTQAEAVGVGFLIVLKDGSDLRPRECSCWCQEVFRIRL
jgi:hypothetical protein